MRTPHAQRLIRRSTLAACLSAGVLVVAGCVSQPVNTDARNVDISARVNGPGVAQNDWEKQSKDPAISPETFYAAGQLAESRELWDRAIDEYDKALKVNHDHLPSLFRLGVLYAKFRKYPQAVTIWNRYLVATNGDPTGYANVGFCFELAGRFDEAENAYEAGIRRDPNSAPCRVNYGLMLARRGRFNQAMHQWQFVLPEAEVHYNLASAYEASDRKVQAKIEFHKALELDPQMADARARLAALGEKVPMPPAVVQAPEAPAESSPTTQPVAIAPTTAPTTAPSVAVNPDAQPETMPAEEGTASTATPSTQPVASSDAPTTEPSPVVETPTTAPTDTAAAPTTAPAMAGTGAPTTAPVTDVSAGDDKDQN